MITLRSDHTIRDDVMSELAWDSRIDESGIGVAVKDRIVTLTGTASSYAEKHAVERAAHRVAGVLDVADDLVVVPPDRLGRSDADLARAVRHALEWDVLVPDERITSTVSDGVITLEGSLELLRERRDAERAVRRLPGVRGVLDRIVVMPRHVDPAAVATAIEGALTRHAEHEAKHITIDVDDGIVTLSGAVGTWAEKRALMGLISHTPGVRAVNDRVRVGPEGKRA